MHAWIPDDRSLHFVDKQDISAKGPYNKIVLWFRMIAGPLETVLRGPAPNGMIFSC